MKVFLYGSERQSRRYFSYIKENTSPDLRYSRNDSIEVRTYLLISTLQFKYFRMTASRRKTNIGALTRLNRLYLKMFIYLYQEEAYLCISVFTLIYLNKIYPNRTKTKLMVTLSHPMELGC